MHGRSSSGTRGGGSGSWQELPPSSDAVQTSESHPLPLSWVAEVPADGQGRGGGKLGLCYCPGKHTQGRGRHRPIARSLAADVSRLRDHFGVSVLVCLLNDAELRSLGLRGYAADVAKAHVELIQFPIIEMAAPQSLEAAAAVVEQIVQRMSEQGQIIAMHCRGGVGRAGLMAACVLLRLGQATSGQHAIDVVRERRCPEAVESRRQEDFVHAYAKWLAEQRQPDGP